MTAEEEQKRICDAVNGDNSAFEELVLENQKNVYNLALKITGNEEDALDISQEAFMKAFSSLRSFRGDSRFSVWMYRMTHNLCIDFLRRKRRFPTIPLAHVDDDGEAGDFEIPDTRDAPEESLLRQELRKTIDASINELGEIHKEIFIMREITGMSYADIATVLNINEGTVKSRLARARKNLAEILGSKGTFPQGNRHNSREEVAEHDKL